MDNFRYILVLNGPNLNLLGRRKPDVYGREILTDIDAWLDNESSCRLVHEQRNSEGQLIELIHEHGFAAGCMGIVLNAGAYTHYSYALADAIEAVEKPVVEVHISNIFAREGFRSNSVIAPVCIGSVSGFGKESYLLAIKALIDYASKD